ASGGSPFGGASPGVHAGGSPFFGGAPPGMAHSPYTPPPTHTGMPASPYAGPGPSFQSVPQMPMHQPQPFLPAGPHNGPYLVPPHSAPLPQLHGGGGGGIQPTTESLATITNKHGHPLHMARQKSGSTGDIQR